MSTKHFIAMSGMHGYLPDFCRSADSPTAAAGILVQVIGVGSGIQRRLARERYYEFREHPLTRQAPPPGVEYAEIQECNCNTPEIHDDL